MTEVNTKLVAIQTNLPNKIELGHNIKGEKISVNTQDLFDRNKTLNEIKKDCPGVEKSGHEILGESINYVVAGALLTFKPEHECLSIFKNTCTCNDVPHIKQQPCESIGEKPDAIYLPE